MSMVNATKFGGLSTTNAVTDLVELLQYWATRRPDACAYTFLSDDERETTLTYGELDADARRIAGYLQHHAEQGDRALLLLPPGLEFIQAFFGCLYAGVLPAPTCYPKANRPMPRLTSIAADTRPAVLLANVETLAQMPPAESSWANVHRAAIDAIGTEWTARWHRPTLSPDDVAFLQYTSGSTSEPKGVMVSHGNLLTNLEAIRRGFKMEVDEIGAADSRGVFWLPAYHDMGLIGGILTPLYVGGHSYLMSPRLFLQRPLRWLSAISRTRSNISGAPNFAYDLCVEKTTPEQRAELDLSCWKVAFCGAEPIRPQTLESFATAFAPSGFRDTSFYPCYGLAESTLLVAGNTGPGKPVIQEIHRDALAGHKGPRPQVDLDAEGATQRLVGCGQPAFGQQVAIVDPETRLAVAPGQVGEIWVSGPSNAMGYWGRPVETEHTFAARLADTGEGPFLRTGDLGFFAHGQLHITGRMKDMIIIRGRNHYPQDIEWCVSQSHEALRPDAGAAFAIETTGGESFVVVHEVLRTHRDADMNEIARAVRRVLVEEQEIDPWAIVLLRPGGLPITTSGKVQRSLCKQQYLGGELKVLHEWINPAQRLKANAKTADAADRPAPGRKHNFPSLAGGYDRVRERVEAWLMNWLVERAGVPREEISRDKPFAEYGLDSLTAVELSHDLEDWLNLELTPVLAWNYPTPARLAEYLARAALGETEGDGRRDVYLGGSRSVAEFARLLAEVEAMSDADVARQLAHRVTTLTR